MSTIAFRTKSQVILWKYEITGQLSDGHWENRRSHGGEPHYRAWQRAQVVERPEGPVGRDFYADYDGYNLTSRALLDAVGGRMIAKVRRGLTFGVDAVELLSSVIDSDGNFTGVPTYTGQYWDDLRAKISKWLQTKKQTMEQVRRAVEKDDFAIRPYDRKAMLADLREMKAVIQTRI